MVEDTDTDKMSVSQENPSTSGLDLEKKEKKPARPIWPTKERKIFVLHILRAAVAVLAAIWIIACWIFGSISKQSTRSHNLKILLVDLDGGDMGKIMVGAAEAISGKRGYATFVQPPNGTTVTVDNAYDQVWRGDYWASLIVMPNSTSSFTTAVEKGDVSYNASSSLTFIWNEIRWALVTESVISPTVSTTVAIAQNIFLTTYAPKVLSAAQLNATQTSVLLNPFATTAINIYPFSVGIKPFLNTVGFVFPGLVQFFFAMGFMGAAASTHMTRDLSTSQNFIIRFILSRLWGFVMAISWAGWFFMFGEGRRGLYDHSFILLTLNMWVYNMISYEYHDACAAFIPLQIMPITVISWIIMNVSAAAFPVQLKPDFFRFDYSVPSYNCFELFITIMTKGSTNRVSRTVPVLFAWLIVTGVIGVFTNRKRCRAAKTMGGKSDQLTDLNDMLEREAEPDVKGKGKRRLSIGKNGEEVGEETEEELQRVRTENEEIAKSLGIEGVVSTGRL